jgi:hypothetical protein
MSTLSNNEAHGDFTNVVVLDYSDLIAIGNGGQQTIAVIPAGGSVEVVQVDETVAFVGTTSLVLDIGTTTGDPDEFIDALDVDAMTVPVTNTGDLFTSGYSQVVSPVAADTSIVLEVTDAAIASATAGKVTIGLRILNPRRFK